MDVQGIGLLWYMVCAWQNDFTGSIIDYGAWPDQGRRYFTKANASKLLEDGKRGLHSGLIALGDSLLKRQYLTQQNQSFMLDLLLVDSGHESELVYNFCRQMRLAGFGERLLPSKGEGNRATNKFGFNEGKAVQGEQRGFEWKLPPPKELRGIKLLSYNTNAWKSFVMDRLQVKDNGPTSLSVFGGSISEHQMLFDHMQSEYRERVKSEHTGRECDEWHSKGSTIDNDLWDCLVGCACAANMRGVRLEGLQSQQKQKKATGERRSWAAMKQAVK